MVSRDAQVKVLVSGSHGLVGAALIPALVRAGHQVTRLVRDRPGPGDASWDVGAGRVDTAALGGTDAVV
ncbi:MAG: hypothetical protein ACRD0J_01265, partial [Acidimicrobiales bacterium]